MNEETFWDIISRLDWSKTGDDEAVLEPAVEALSRMPEEEICEFEEILAEKLFELDGETYARNIGKHSFGKSPKRFSADEFLYARGSVVANGKDYFEQVLADP